MQPRVPDFIYIGPPKTGTTFLRSYFSYHPEIYWVRDAHAFIQNPVDQAAYLNKVTASIEQKCYVDMFEALATGVKIANEEQLSKSQFVPNAEVPREVAYYNVEEVFKDIKSCLPDVRILFSIRNQVDWLRSNYAHFVARLPNGQRAFADFLCTFQGKGLVEAGHYHNTIELLHEIFGKQNVHVTVLELNRLDQERFLRRLCGFLQADYLPFPKENQKRNEGRSPVKVALLRAIPGGLREFAAARLSGLGEASWIKRALNSMSTRELLSVGEIKELSTLYRRSNADSQKLLGISLDELGYPV